MHITIEYCGEWNYQARAARLAEKIKHSTGTDALLLKSSGGVFEITVNEQLIYSKKATGVFPRDDDIIDTLKNR